MSEPVPFRQRLARNTLASMATNVWTIVLTVVSLPLVLHGLGAKAFGVWVFLQTFSTTSGWLSVPATGLSIATTRLVAARAGEAAPSALRRASGATALVFVCSGVVLGAALAAATPTIIDLALDPGPLGVSMAIVGLAVGAQVLAEHVCLAITSVLEGLQEVALARGLDALRKTAVAATIAVVATAGGDLESVAIASAAAAGLAATASFLGCWTSARLAVARPVRSEVVEVLRYAGTVSALTGTGVLHRTMDRTIAGVVFGPSAVSLVEIANQLQAGTTALLSASTYPVLSSAPWLAQRDDRPALRALTDRATRYSVLITLPICALAIALADPFVRTWVGNQYQEAIGLTQVAVVFVVLAAPLQAGSNLLQGVGEAGTVLRASLASVLVNLAVSVVLVQWVGLVGVMIGTIVGVLALFPLLTRAIDQILDRHALTIVVPAVLRAAPPALAAGIVAGAVVLAPWPPGITLAVGGLGGGLAALVIAFVWSVPPVERAELRSALRRHA